VACHLDLLDVEIALHLAAHQGEKANRTRTRQLLRHTTASDVRSVHHHVSAGSSKRRVHPLGMGPTHDAQLRIESTRRWGDEQLVLVEWRRW